MRKDVEQAETEEKELWVSFEEILIQSSQNIWIASKDCESGFMPLTNANPLTCHTPFFLFNTDRSCSIISNKLFRSLSIIDAFESDSIVCGKCFKVRFACRIFGGDYFRESIRTWFGGVSVRDDRHWYMYVSNCPFALYSPIAHAKNGNENVENPILFPLLPFPTG